MSASLAKSEGNKPHELEKLSDNVQKIPISINKRNIGFPKKEEMNPLNSKVVPKAQLFLEKKPPKPKVVLKQSQSKQKLTDKNV